MRLGNNEFYFLVSHFLQLVFRNTLLKCKQELFIDSVCFVNDLTPSVLTCCLGTKYSKVFRREFEIVITYTIREKEVWLLFVFSYNLLFKDQIVNDSWIILGNANILGCFRSNLYLCGKKDEQKHYTGRTERR